MKSAGALKMAEERSRLGRGLASLIGDVGEEATGGSGKGQRRVPVEFIQPNPRNPRRMFTEHELEELAASVKERGVIQPIVVREAKEIGRYEIIAGERRWRASQRAGLHEVPVTVIEATDEQSLEFAIIENVQRADLNPIEEAQGYQALIDEFKHDQDEVAKIVGKSRPHVTNTLRLMKLTEPVKQLVRAGLLSAGHARQLIGIPGAEAVAAEIVEKKLSVRQLEQLMKERAKEPAGTPASGKPRTVSKDASTRDLEQRMSNVLGLKVTIDYDGKSGGALRIHYSNLEQLDDILARLERKK